MDLDQALTTGAMALFGEKYGERSARGFDPDLQQGTVRRHARARAPAISASARSCTKASISAGVRRIEAITGEGALRRFQKSRRTGARVREHARSGTNLSTRRNARWKSSSNTNAAAEEQIAQAQAASSKSRRARSRASRFWRRRFAGMDREQLRTMVDSLRNQVEDRRWWCWRRRRIRTFRSSPASPRT